MAGVRARPETHAAVVAFYEGKVRCKMQADLFYLRSPVWRKTALNKLEKGGVGGGGGGSGSRKKVIYQFSHCKAQKPPRRLWEWAWYNDSRIKFEKIMGEVAYSIANSDF